MAASDARLCKASLAQFLLQNPMPDPDFCPPQCIQSPFAGKDFCLSPIPDSLYPGFLGYFGTFLAGIRVAPARRANLNS